MVLLGTLLGFSVIDSAASFGSELQHTAQGPKPLIPDLTVLPPHDIQLEMLDWKTGGPYLRFGNSIANVGKGPLELRAHPESGEGEVFTVNQRVYTTSRELNLEFEIGQFIFHETHDHWHLDDFVRYEIWSATVWGSLKRRMLTSGKISYCMTDVRDASPELTLAGQVVEEPIYLSCKNRRQGLSVGWVDTYHFWYDGQYLDVGDLPSGLYALRSLVDPDDVVQELYENNNEAIVYIRIDGMELTVYDSRADLPKAEPKPASQQEVTYRQRFFHQWRFTDLENNHPEYIPP